MPQSDSTNHKPSHWEGLAKDRPPMPILPGSQLTVRLSHGVWFGVAMGIGFAIGFLISFLLLAAFVGFVVMSQYPDLFK